MQRVMITFATLMEAKETIRLINAQQTDTQLYEFKHGLLLITGMGSINACYSLSKYLSQVDEIWSYGIAGTLKEETQFKTVAIQRVSKHLSIPNCMTQYTRDFSANIFPTLEIENKGVSLISSDYPINHSQIRNDLAKNHDLIDMEGYGIAHACKMANKPLIMRRTISDTACENTAALIRERLPHLSKEIALCIVDALS